jgi:uncharacterized damage-inducible protein DinB
MRIPICFTMLVCLIFAVPSFAQDPLVNDAKAMWDGVKNNVVRAAEKMPEENYAFKPVPEVRSFGQLIGHVADAQFMLCAIAKGEKRAPAGVEKSKTTKADLVASLKESVAYCDAVYAEMTGAKATETIKMFGRDRTRLGALLMNTSHSNEHYGNIVTYMRIKGLVPPSSEPRK